MRCDEFTILFLIYFWILLTSLRAREELTTAQTTHCAKSGYLNPHFANYQNNQSTKHQPTKHQNYELFLRHFYELNELPYPWSLIVFPCDGTQFGYHLKPKPPLTTIQIVEF